MRNSSSRLALRVAAIAALAGAFLVPAPAKAWVSFGFALPPVVIAPAPAPYPYPYYPPAYPPGYYAPPPPPPAQGSGQAQAPAQSPAPQLSQNQVPYGATCFAGNYTCAAAPYSHVGSVCSCPGWGAPSFGTVQ